VQALTRWLLIAFLSPTGLLVLGALDSSILFAAPLLVDTAVVVLVARNPRMFWLYPLLATAGTVTGGALTFWIGWKAGEAGLQRFVPAGRLTRALDRGRKAGALALATLGLVPPPFPFTVVTLTAGALELDPVRFFVSLSAIRCIRFGAEAALALIYGHRILIWISSDLARAMAALIIGLTIAGAIVSAVKLLHR
jgi:membrane protein YqaA with SNARE-associated domain